MEDAVARLRKLLAKLEDTSSEASSLAHSVREQLKRLEARNGAVAREPREPEPARPPARSKTRAKTRRGRG